MALEPLAVAGLTCKHDNVINVAPTIRTNSLLHGSHCHRFHRHTELFQLFNRERRRLGFLTGDVHRKTKRRFHSREGVNAGQIGFVK